MKKLAGVSLFIFWTFVTSILTAGLFFYQNNKNSPIGNSVLSSERNNTPQEIQTKLDATEISRHDSAGDCWMIIDNKVYNITNYLGIHPGRAGTIIPYCGKEATNVFVTKDTGSSHSANAYSMLTSYYIGDLNQKIGVARTSQNSENQNTENQKVSQTETIAPAGSLAPQPPPISADRATLDPTEIGKHNSQSDCWFIINSKVYNVTNYLPKHPGGIEAISLYCGKDATQAFSQQHGRAPYIGSSLDLFYIGNLSQSSGTENVQQNTQNTSISTPSASKSEDDDEYEDD